MADHGLRTEGQDLLDDDSDRRVTRPARVVVLFDREQEIRFDYNEIGTVARDTPTLQNVAPLPDLSLVILDKKTPSGSFVGLRYLFAHWTDKAESTEEEVA